MSVWFLHGKCYLLKWKINYYTCFLCSSLKLSWPSRAAESLGVRQLMPIQQPLIIIMFHKLLVMLLCLSLVLYLIYGITEITALIWAFLFVACLGRCSTMQLPNFSDFSITAMSSYELYFHTYLDISNARLSVIFSEGSDAFKKFFFFKNRWSLGNAL